MKKYTKIILPVVILALGLGIWQITTLNSGNQAQNANQEVFANLKIESGSNSQSFDISGFVGKTALEATEAKTGVIANGTGVNAFVTSINGRQADTGKHEFWELDVNDVEAQVGAGTYIIKNHDEIEWKISNY
jgi:cell division protein YceG involved in septum cleavage